MGRGPSATQCSNMPCRQKWGTNLHFSCSGFNSAKRVSRYTCARAVMRYLNPTNAVSGTLLLPSLDSLYFVLIYNTIGSAPRILLNVCLEAHRGVSPFFGDASDLKRKGEKIAHKASAAHAPALAGARQTGAEDHWECI